MLNLQSFIGDKMVSKSELAEEIGVSIQTVETWQKCHDDFPKSVRLGHKVFYSLTEFVEWLTNLVQNGN